jgi:hypothetical protein
MKVRERVQERKKVDKSERNRERKLIKERERK